MQAFETHAIKEIIADQLAAAMKESGLNKTATPQRMHTSRRQLGGPHLARRACLNQSSPHEVQSNAG